MSFNLVAAEKAGVAVAVLCRALGVSRSGFYARRGRGDPPKVARARKRDVAVAAVFKEKRERYGAPRVRAVLRARGEAMSRKSVAASMRAQGLVARPRRRFVSTTDSSHGRPTPPNLVNRNFCAAKPNEVWVADTTYLPTQSGFVYLVCVLDLFARRLVGWSVADDISADLAAFALRRATAERRPPRGLVVHTDRGGEFLSRSWTAVLKAAGARPSASATGNCFDNAVAESFFSTLEFEGPATRSWRDAHDAELSLPGFLDDWYNDERLHSYNGQASPSAREARWQLNRLAA